MASLLDLLQQGDLPTGDASIQAPPTDAIQKLLALIRPTANGANMPGVDVAPLSIAPDDPTPSMPSASVPAPLANTPQAAASPSAPTPAPTAAAPTPQSATPNPITTGSTSQAAPDVSSLTMPGALPSSGGDILREIGAFVGGLSGSGGISAAMGQHQVDQQNNATLRALVSKGVKYDDAVNMVQNPDLLKSVLPTLFGRPPIEKLDFGQTANRVNPDGSLTNITPGGGNGLTGGVPIPGDPNKHGSDYIASITDPGAKTLAAQAQAIVNGDQTMPDAMSNKSPQALMLRQMAYQIDPNFTPAKAAQRKATLTELGKTEPNSMGGQITNGRASVGHMLALADSGVALNNSGGWIGSAMNHASTALASPGGDRDSAVNSFRKNRQTFAGESVKFITGGNGGEGDRQAAEANFDENAGPGALASALEASKQQMLEKFSGLQRAVDGSLEGTGMAPTVIDADTQKQLDQLDARIADLRAQQAGTYKPSTTGSAASAPAAGHSAQPPQALTKTIGNVTYTKVNGQWMQ